MKFISRSKIWFSLSLSIMVIGLVFGLVRGVNVGIDFSGGTMMQFEMGKVVEVQTVKDAIKEFKYDPEILHAGQDKTDVVVRTKVDLNNAQRQEVFKVMKAKFNLKDDAMVSAEQFGPSIGKEIQLKAFYGVLVACLFMLIYIAFRFEIYFGLSAVIALIHDVLILLSVYSIFYIPIDTSFIAAVLTVVGYSVNDTIVVFDRIRENIRLLKKHNYEELAEKSINETIGRSINTSFTTLLVISALYLLGVDAIKNFSFPLLVGIMAGTYSSIFIASPIWVIWKTRLRKRTA